MNAECGWPYLVLLQCLEPNHHLVILLLEVVEHKLLLIHLGLQALLLAVYIPVELLQGLALQHHHVVVLNQLLDDAHRTARMCFVEGFDHLPNLKHILCLLITFFLPSPLLILLPLLITVLHCCKWLHQLIQSLPVALFLWWELYLPS